MGPRILVADDSADIREIMEAVLLRAGHDVLVVEDGHEAISRIAEFQPDAVVTDFKMPRADGLDVVRALRSDVAHEMTPVLLLTAMEPGEERVRDALRHRYVTLQQKPPRLRALPQLLEALIAEAQVSRDADAKDGAPERP